MNSPSNSAPSQSRLHTAQPEPAAPRGRPSGYSEEVVERLRTVIREFGISDCAAMVRLEMTPSSLTRWRREHPELKARLQQAREEFREAQLTTIMNAASAEHGRGWRAAAWLLERVFPADYAKSAAERARFEQAELRREEREMQEEESARADERCAEAWAAVHAEVGEADGGLEDEDARLRWEIAEAKRILAAMSPAERAAYDQWAAEQRAEKAAQQSAAASEGRFAKLPECRPGPGRSLTARCARHLCKAHVL